jgi:hypothetical protein
MISLSSTPQSSLLSVNLQPTPLLPPSRPRAPDLVCDDLTAMDHVLLSRCSTAANQRPNRSRTMTISIIAIFQNSLPPQPILTRTHQPVHPQSPPSLFWNIYRRSPCSGRERGGAVVALSIWEPTAILLSLTPHPTTIGQIIMQDLQIYLSPTWRRGRR